MYRNWSFFTFFSPPPKKRGKRKRRTKYQKRFKQLFKWSNRFSPFLIKMNLKKDKPYAAFIGLLIILCVCVSNWHAMAVCELVLLQYMQPHNLQDTKLDLVQYLDLPIFLTLFIFVPVPEGQLLYPIM